MNWTISQDIFFTKAQKLHITTTTHITKPPLYVWQLSEMCNKTQPCPPRSTFEYLTAVADVQQNLCILLAVFYMDGCWYVLEYMLWFSGKFSVDGWEMKGCYRDISLQRLHRGNCLTNESRQELIIGTNSDLLMGFGVDLGNDCAFVEDVLGRCCWLSHPPPQTRFSWSLISFFFKLLWCIVIHVSLNTFFRLTCSSLKLLEPH